MLSFPKPEVGDVVFTYSGGLDALLSSVGQRLVDSVASYSTPSFSHVSMVVNETCVIEAMTGVDDAAGTPPGGWGVWSGVELKAGVRVSPIMDTLVSGYSKGCRLAVLRRADTTHEMQDALVAHNPCVAALIGQAYALTALKESAEAFLPQIVSNALADKVFNWTSMPEDIAAQMGVDAAFRDRLARTFPDYSLGFESRTYFCSELVAELLTASRMLDRAFTEPITPIGLFTTLTTDQWIDVTASDYSRDAVELQMQSSPASVAAGYTSTLAAIGVVRYTQATGKTLEFVERAIKRIRGEDARGGAAALPF